MSRLCKKRIVITRAPHQAGEFADLLHKRGAIPILYPCIDIIPPDDVSALDEALQNLSTFDWLVITSSNTVEALRRRLPLEQKFRVKIATVGASTAAALKDTFGIEADFIPDVQAAEHLAEQLPIKKAERVLLPQSAIARPDLADIMTQRGAAVTLVRAYKTVIGSGGDNVPHLLETGQIDAVTFTSSSTVTHFIRRIGYVPDVLVVCIGVVTAQTAYGAGFKRVLSPEDDYSLAGLIAVMENHL